MKPRDLKKSYLDSTGGLFWGSLILMLLIVFLGIAFHRLFYEANYKNLYWSILDPLGLFFGLLTFLISIIITLRIQFNTDKQQEGIQLSNMLKQLELENNNTYIINKTEEIKTNIEKLIQQYQNIEVINSFKDIMKKLNELYDTTIEAEDGRIVYNGNYVPVKMQLKIMNHSASFGRLLCSDVEVLKSYDNNFDKTIQDGNSLKRLIENVRRIQADVYIKMKYAYSKIADRNNKYYITLSASKDINGKDTADLFQTAYNIKYLSKLNVEGDTSFCERYDPTKKFIQKIDSSFSEYLIGKKQKAQIFELANICKIYDAYSFTIPFQAFVTLPVEENINDEKFYQCIFFFINDNTIGKGLQLSAITTRNIAFVKGIAKVLDAEKQHLIEYKTPINDK